MSCTFHGFRKKTGHITTEINVYSARMDLQTQALSEQKVDSHCADIQSTYADTPDYTSIDHRIIQPTYVNDAISKYM